MKSIVSPSFLKQRARQIKKAKSLSQHEALNEASVELGFSNYKHFLNVLEENKKSTQTTLGKAQTFSEKNVNLSGKTCLLPRLNSGSDFANIYREADQFQFERDEVESQHVGVMDILLNHLKAELVRWYDADSAGKLKIESFLSQAVRELEGKGHYLFGVKRTIPKIVGDQRTTTTICTVYWSHERSNKIIRDQNGNMFIPALLTEEVRG